MIKSTKPSTFYHLIVKVFKNPLSFGIDKSKIAVAGGCGGAWIVMGAIRKLIEMGQEKFVQLMILACPDVSMFLGETWMKKPTKHELSEQEAIE